VSRYRDSRRYEELARRLVVVIRYAIYLTALLIVALTGYTASVTGLWGIMVVSVPAAALIAWMGHRFFRYRER